VTRVSRFLLTRDLRRSIAALGEEGVILARIVNVVALRTAMLCLIPVLVAIGFSVHEARVRSADNRALIADAVRTRERIVRGFKRTDVLTCRVAETLKEQNRAEAKRNFARLDQTLALFGIPKTPAVEARALSDLREALDRNRRGLGGGQYGCGDLPPKFGEGG
jgi:hypothetical protein